jgi:predicted Zn finger-like uncharacterized protein
MGPDMPIVCPSCRALIVVKREQSSEEPHRVWCLRCQRSINSRGIANERAGSFSKRALLASEEAVAALAARTGRIRLQWDAGYLSEYPDPLDEDTQAVTLNAEARTVTLHAETGSLHRFLDSGEQDDDGYTI